MGASGLSGSCGRGDDTTVMSREEERPSARHDKARVKEKVKKAFPDKSDAEVENMTKRLSSVEELVGYHFPHLMRRGTNALDTTFQEAKAFGKKGFSTPRERDECSKRLLDDQQAVFNIKVSLKLYELKGEHKKRVAKAISGLFPRGHFDYGPYHAAIQIGDVILDWNADSLVIPHTATPEASAASAQLVAEAPVSVATTHRSQTPITQTQVWATPVETMKGFIHEANFTVDLISHNELLIRQLAEVVVLYNTKYDYDILKTNCQHFVTEVLEALGGDDHVKGLKERTNQIRELMRSLATRGAQSPQYELYTHASLDEYVRINLDEMSKDDLNFCHCKYVLFHTLYAVEPSRQAWRCNPDSCQHKVIEQKLL